MATKCQVLREFREKFKLSHNVPFHIHDFFSLSLFVVPRLHFQALVLCVCVFVAASVRYFSSDGCTRDALVESSRGIVHFIAPSVG